MDTLVKRNIVLTRQKHKPGSAVQRFGNWRKREPSVLVDNQFWLELGKPDELTVTFGPNSQEKQDLEDLVNRIDSNLEKVRTLCR